MWLCRSCELKEPTAPDPQCCLCPIAGGALKPTTVPGAWCHAACMQWIPEVTVGDPARMEPIDRIPQVQKERWELQCCICRQRMGAKIQCCSCFLAYHPLCARMAGLHLELRDPKDPSKPLQLVTFCQRHCTPRPELAGVYPEDPSSLPGARLPAAMAKAHAAEDAAAARSLWGGQGLFNAQPYREPPKLRVPDCPSGCARAARVECERVSHGTGAGAGCTSNKGFWIPTQDPDAS
ncbi:MAG: PHD-zinc-finger like domain-containing protein, partial [Monoraphidium minutum]